MGEDVETGEQKQNIQFWSYCLDSIWHMVTLTKKPRSKTSTPSDILIHFAA